VTDTSAHEHAVNAPDGASVAGQAIGILGGTFNPPHLGHVAVARHARAELGLERVLLMPANMPPHKGDGEDPGAVHRLRMCELAVEGVAGISACALELDRGGPSYTVDTLRAIHASHPDAELTFIVGADTASTLASWREPAELLGLARLAVAARAGSDHWQVIQAVAGISVNAPGEPVPTRVEFLEMDVIEVSSSMVRARAAHEQPIDDLVGPGVAAYIAEQRLYRAPAKVVS
jgi:nicotinate-nucleotide adenylyltransferase